MADGERSTVRDTILAMFGWQADARVFDPLDFETYPQRLTDLAGAAEDGLDNGDLAPLASYLRVGYPVPSWLSARLADAIDPAGKGRFRIKAIGRKRGEKGERAAAERCSRNANIGAYVAYYIHKHGQGSYDAAIADARDKFGLGKKSSAPAQAYADYRATAFQEDGSIHPFYAVDFDDLRWKHYPFKRSD